MFRATSAIERCPSMTNLTASSLYSSVKLRRVAPIRETPEEWGSYHLCPPDRGRFTGYRPGQRLKDLTRATWPHCAFPGCTTRAVRAGSTCDLDHTQPWPAGPTCSCNLSPCAAATTG